jgi:hypothetical protein
VLVAQGGQALGMGAAVAVAQDQDRDLPARQSARDGEAVPLVIAPARSWRRRAPWRWWSTHSREPLRDSRRNVSSASTRPASTR